MLDKAYKKIYFSGYELSINIPENCCIMKNQEVIKISAIGIKSSKNVVIGKKFIKTSSLPNCPIADSRDIGIHIVDLLSDKEELYNIEDIENKACLFFYKGTYYAIGLLHH